MGNLGKNIFLWFVIFLLLVGLFNVFYDRGQQTEGSKIYYSDFTNAITSGRVQEVTIEGDVVSGRMSDGTRFSTDTPANDPDMMRLLREHNVQTQVKPPQSHMHPLLSLLLNWFPMIFLIGVWIFFMRQMQSGGGRAMGFGRSRAKLLTERKDRVTFDDVAGIDEARQELEEIVDFLKEPQKFHRLGCAIPRGILLVGAPGTGKTLLARAIAGEANVPFFTISGSDFVEMFVGVGASRVRDMFDQAKKSAPCIVFIDEIDAVGRHRGAGLGGGNDEREQTLNQLLVEMDGFEPNEGIILIAATNRPDVLDPALLRPGRFDRQVVVPMPDLGGREKILKVHMKKVPVATDVDPSVLARGTPGFSGADLANLVNEAALRAARLGQRFVMMEDFEHAKDKVLMGSERRSMAMTEKEKERTAYHEAGHALVGMTVPGHDPVHKVSIIPRGRALGVTMALPEQDRYGFSKSELLSKLAMMFGGRVAESIIYGPEHVTTGAADDIKQATELARKMVTEWGMSDLLGPLRYNENEQEVFLGHSVARTQNVSEATAEKIDGEVRRLITDAEKWATKILNDHVKDLKKIAAALLEYETLSGDELKILIAGHPITRSDKNGSSGPKVKSSVPTSNKPSGRKKDVGLHPKPQEG